MPTKAPWTKMLVVWEPFWTHAIRESTPIWSTETHVLQPIPGVECPFQMVPRITTRQTRKHGFSETTPCATHPPNWPNMKLVSLSVHSSNPARPITKGILARVHVSSGIVVCKICSKHLFTERSCWRANSRVATGCNIRRMLFGRGEAQKRSRSHALCKSWTCGILSRSTWWLVATFSSSLLANCGLPKGVPSALTPWRSGGRVWSPRHTMASGSDAQASAGSMPTRRLHIASVPNLCLPQVDLDAGVSPQLAAKDVRYRRDQLSGLQETYKSSKITINRSSGLNCFSTATKAPRQNKAGMRASPCSPPSPW